MPDEKFTLEPRLLLACYICDDSGKELEPADYKEKGTALKVVTEEFQQQVTHKDFLNPLGRRYYKNPEVYWDPKIYPDEDLKTLQSGYNAWLPLKNYIIGDIVSCGGKNYSANIAHKSSLDNIPTTDSSDTDETMTWKILSPVKLVTEDDILSSMKSAFGLPTDIFIIGETLANAPVTDPNARFVPPTWKGVNAYKVNDPVKYMGNIYVCIADIPAAPLPATPNPIPILASTSWKLYVFDASKYSDLIATGQVLSGKKGPNPDGSSNVFRQTTYFKTKPQIVPDPANPPLGTMEIRVADPTKGVFTYMHICDKIGVHDKCILDPNAEVSIPEDTRDSQPYETYTKKTPSRVYRVRINDGLNGGILKLINDTVMLKYTKLTKLIISNNVSAELKWFQNHYTINQDIFKTLFTRFKNIEISNNLLSVIFPKGDLELDSLKLKSCKVIVDNTIIKVAKTFDINACEFNTHDPAGKIKSIVFNVAGDVKIQGLSFVGLAKVSVITEAKDKKADFSKISYNFIHPKADIKKGTSLLNISGFKTVTINDISKTDTCDIPSVILCNIIKGTVVKFIKLNAGSKAHTAPLVIADSCAEFSLSSFTDTSKSSVGCCISLANFKGESKLSIMDSTIDTGSIFKLNSCEIGDFKISGSTVTVDSLYSGLNIKPFTEFNITSKSTVNFNHDFDMDFNNCTIDGSTINCANGIINIANKLKLSDSFIKPSKDFTIKLSADKASVSLNNSPLELPNGAVKIFSKSSTSGTKIEFIKSIVTSDIFQIGSVQDIDMQYSPIAGRHTTIDSVKTLKSTESPIRATQVQDFNILNVAEMPATVFNIEEAGTFKIYSENVTGALTFTIIDGSVNIDRVSKNSGICETYTYAELAFGLRVTSDGCNSSAYIIDKVSSLIVSPLCADFKLFRPLDPKIFASSTVGKKLYDEIYYGPNVVA